jgi:hypothetical protein
VLCQRADRPITREHIFARWLIRQVHGARLVPSGIAASAAQLRIARVIAPVCADCNAGWMSGLEVSFRRMLFSRPRTGPLQTRDRVTLSRWFTKTAVLLAHAHGGALVGERHRAQLVSGMPDDIEVFLARRRRPCQNLDYSLDVVADEAPRVRSVAVLVDDLLAHVAARGTLSSRHGTRLWPLRTHTLRWDTLPVIALPATGGIASKPSRRPLAAR